MLLIISIQRCMGYTKLWLPKRIRALSIPKAQLDRILVYTLPICRKLELWTRPRLLFFETKTVRRLIGILLCFLSLNLLCSAPLIGQIPSGIALCVLGFGSVERDGIVLLLGIFLSILSTILTFGFIYAIVTKMLTYLVP